MYASRLAEVGPTAEILERPRHPYTAGLVDAQPDRAFTPIPGMPPELTDLPAGCAFAPRCAHASVICATVPQPRPDAGPLAPSTHVIACHHPLREAPHAQRA